MYTDKPCGHAIQIYGDTFMTQQMLIDSLFQLSSHKVSLQQKDLPDVNDCNGQHTTIIKISCDKIIIPKTGCHDNKQTPITTNETAQLARITYKIVQWWTTMT